MDLDTEKCEVFGTVRGGRPSPTVSSGQLAQGGEKKKAAVREPRASYTGAYSQQQALDHITWQDQDAQQEAPPTTQSQLEEPLATITKGPSIFTQPSQKSAIYVVARPAGMRHVVFFSRTKLVYIRISLVDRPDASSKHLRKHASETILRKENLQKDARAVL